MVSKERNETALWMLVAYLPSVGGNIRVYSTDDVLGI